MEFHQTTFAATDGAAYEEEMIASTIEKDMEERYRSVRQRLGITSSPPRVLARKEPLPAPQAVLKPQPLFLKPKVNVLSSQPSARVNSKWKGIVHEVCDKHDIRFSDILSHVRHKRIVAARCEAIYRLRTETELSFPEIGRRMGGFDHSTAIHSYHRHKKRLEEIRMAELTEALSQPQ